MVDANKLKMQLRMASGGGAAKSVAKRLAKTRSMRLRVFDRDGWRCVQCGCKKRDALTLDHIVPRCAGGPTTFDNLQTLCRACNRRKGGTIPQDPNGKG